jgi:hypothetical protein
MGKAVYRIVKKADGWAIEHDGDVSQAYITKEAALEAAVATIMRAMAEGYEVHLSIPAGAEGRWS